MLLPQNNVNLNDILKVVTLRILPSFIGVSVGLGALKIDFCWGLS